MPKVKDLMTKIVVTIDANSTVFDAAQLMNDKGVSCLVVMDGIHVANRKGFEGFEKTGLFATICI